MLVQRLDHETYKINQNRNDIHVLNETLYLLANDITSTANKAFSEQHDLFIATTMNHVDSVLTNLRRQVF